MKLAQYNSEEELIELLDAGKITQLDFVTHQSPELSKDFEDYCDDRGIEQDEESAESFLEMRQQIFDEAFVDGNA